MKKINLSIPTPCHEDWQKMTPNEQGRFCSSCQKTVVDFTSMTDSELIAFFQKSQGSLCGRMLPDQLNREIGLPKKRLPWIRYFFQIALPAFLFSQKSFAQKGRIKCVDTIQVKSPHAGNVSEVLEGRVGGLMIQKEELINETKGKVTDIAGNPLSYVTVMIKGTNRSVATDSSGYFSIKAKDLNGKTLVVSNVGYETTERKIEKDEFMSVVLVQALSGEVVVTGVMVEAKKKSFPLIKQIIDNAFSKFSVYLNPAHSSSYININTQKLDAGTYVISVISTGGEVVLNKEVEVRGRKQLLPLQLPNLATGNYYISLFNKKTTKSFSEKLLIQ